MSALPVVLDGVATTVATASVSGAVLAAVVWALCRVVPRLPLATRAWLWWIVAVRFLVALAGVPLVPVAIPALASMPEGWTARDATGQSPSSPRTTTAALDAMPPSSGPAGSALQGTDMPSAARPATLASVALAARPLAGFAFLALVAATLVEAVLAFRRTRDLVTRATPAPATWTDLVDDVRRRLGLARAPDVRVAEGIDSPRLAWAGRAVVLLPDAALDRWTTPMRRMAIGHELAHLARHDLAWGAWVSAAERLFVFHPLARLAAREYQIAREAACDAAVVSLLDHAPYEYGRLLLSLGIRRRGSALAVAGASCSARSLKRRLLMLDTASRPLARGIAGTFVVLVALLAATQPRLVARAAAAADMPLLGFARADAPAGAAEPASPARPARSAIPTPPAPPTPAELPAPATEGQPAAPLPPPPASPAPPAPPAPPMPPADGFFTDDFADRIADAWVFLRGQSTTMHGGGRDRGHAESLRQGADTLFWFERDGREYVVRDPAVLAAIGSALAPMEDSGRAQARLGAEQAAIGAKQAEIGAQQAAVGAEQAAIGAKLGAIAAEHARSVSDAMRDGRRTDMKGQDQSVRARQADLEEKMKALETDMRAFEDRMRPFEAQQRDLETQMRALEAAARKARETSADAMRELLDRALRSGAAQPVK